jgi:aryl-alcohol dehydrogenase-like predicted oxidoreductase
MKKLRLDDYRLLGGSGLRVSPLCLGTMTFGTEWGWGAPPDACRDMVDRYIGLGGNFIDTANKYTEGAAETILGELLGERRDRVVLATKYSLSMREKDPNYCGNHRKSLVQGVEASLRRLKTDHVDLLYVHAWDALTPIAEVMRALDDVVRAGKALYLGVSDMPAWKIAQANTLAELRGWTSFVSLQAQYNLLERTPERDLIPMARDLRLGVLPWSPLAGGALTGKHSSAHDGKRDAPKLDAHGERIVSALREVATACGSSPGRVALRWLTMRPGVACPVLGARTLQQLEDNLGCLEVDLTQELCAKLDAASKIELGFPHDFLASDMVKDVLLGGTRVHPAP